VEIATIVNGDEFSRSILSKADNLVVSNIKNSVLISTTTIKDNITGSGVSKRDGGTVTSHSASVASLPALTIDEIVAISESRPEQPGNKSRAISDRGNSLVRADTLADTGPSAGGLGVGDVSTTVNSPSSSSDDSVTSGGDIARTSATRRSGSGLGSRLRSRATASGNSSDGSATDEEDVGNPTGSSVKVDLRPPAVSVALGADSFALLLADGVDVGLRDGSDDAAAGGRTSTDVDTVSPDSDGSRVGSDGKSD
jgi:hypothetical protein